MAAERGGGRFLQFVKAPVPGKVKTRLVPALGAAGAAEVARGLAERVAQDLRSVPVGWSAALCADDPGDPWLHGLAARTGRELLAQGDGDLGQRMQRACSDALRHAAAVVVVGSDCCGFDRAYLQRAAQCLEDGADAVLGPAVDGGYVLVGFRRLPEGVMEGIAWGSDGVAQAQRRRFRARGLRWAELAPRANVDRPSDLWLIGDVMRGGLRRG